MVSFITTLCHDNKCFKTTELHLLIWIRCRKQWSRSSSKEPHLVSCRRPPSAPSHVSTKPCTSKSRTLALWGQLDGALLPTLFPSALGQSQLHGPPTLFSALPQHPAASAVPKPENLAAQRPMSWLPSSLGPHTALLQSQSRVLRLFTARHPPYFYDSINLFQVCHFLIGEDYF